MLPHHIVHRHAQGKVQLVLDEVERVTTDQPLHIGLGDLGMVLTIPVAHQPVVRVDLHHHVLVHVVHTDRAVVLLVALSQRHRNRNHFDVGDLHGLPSLCSRSVIGLMLRILAWSL